MPSADWPEIGMGQGHNNCLWIETQNKSDKMDDVSLRAAYLEDWMDSKSQLELLRIDRIS